MKKQTNAEHLFECVLSVSIETIAIKLEGIGKTPWSDFLLNPRRLRGSDFLMRWSQGVWSEERLKEAINDSKEYFALPYGPSSVAPENDIRAFELYFERLESAGLGWIKRPDILIFPTSCKLGVMRKVKELGGLEELPFTAENDDRIQFILSRALLAVECENSLWRARLMPDYNTPLTPQKRLSGRPGLKKSAVLPTIIIKEEDREPLLAWQANNKIPIHIWHAFFDEAFGISLSEIEELITNGYVEPTRQVFQAPGGATTEKVIYKTIYRYGYPLAKIVQEPQLVADAITDKNGHILPYVRFVGGKSALRPEALAILNLLKRQSHDD